MSDRLRFIVDGFCGGAYAGIVDRKGEVDVSKYTERMGFTRVHLDAIADELNAKHAPVTAQPDATAPAEQIIEIDDQGKVHVPLVNDDHCVVESRELPPVAPLAQVLGEEPPLAAKIGETVFTDRWGREWLFVRNALLRFPASTSGQVKKLSCGCLANNLSRCPIHDAP